MKRFLSTTLLLLAFSTVLLGQDPAPICGLPEISKIPETETIILRKRMTPSEYPKFEIREHYDENTLIEVEFVLMHDEDDFSIYVEKAELDSQHVDSLVVAELAAVFKEHTFAGSIDSSQGIKDIAEGVFGQPPDIDHNGKVYLLLIDVRDGFVPDSSETFVAGYFDPLDQTLKGNGADIIYLDTNPGLINGHSKQFTLSILAHEYQHLIHYGQDQHEELWINEGLSELSPVLMGLPHRDFASYLANTNVQLDQFDNELADYARCGLFFLYSWIQMGTSYIQDLVQRDEIGIEGIERALTRRQELSFDDLVLNWHKANFIRGDGELGYGGGYTIPRPVLHDRIIDFPEDDFHREVKRLGAHWTLITGGDDLFIYCDNRQEDPTISLINGDTKEFIDGTGLQLAGYSDPGFGTEYDNLVVLGTSSSKVYVAAQFGLYVDAKGGYSETTLSYDGDEDPQDVTFISLQQGTERGEAAVSYTIPVGVELADIRFMCLSNDSVEISLYQGALEPEYVFYSDTILAPFGLGWTTHRLPRGHYASPGPLYVSLSSWENALAYNEHTTTSYSYYRPPGETAFYPLHNFEIEGGQELVGNWSIRLSYMVPDTSEDQKLEIPLFVSPFYPNPVRGGELTKLSISPGHAAEIRLYNLLGQEVYRLDRTAGETGPVFWNGIMSNGMPAPSGIYMARISNGDRRPVGRRLVLIR
ncbi:T9SS type A sorting domain-containing protein [Candidatus Neomarinimicrobiota bacterium]